MPDINLEKVDFAAPEWLHLRQLYHWKWWWRCKVKILVVTDDICSFDNTAPFGLGKVLEIVKAGLWPHVAFEITTAHRGPTAADKSNFKFDADDLSQYHQIWMFGYARSGAGISQSELRSITQFMDDGGGVFATGDHQDLGVDLCAEVPRIRSMRRWHWPLAGPNGEPIAPHQTGADRHDTLTGDPATLTIEASQTDKIPQKIVPKMYSRWYPGGILGKVAKYPHPVLCGPDGVITHLPDHMHEGLVEVPTDISQTYTFDGYQSVEYPTVAGNQQPPQVIAEATNFVTGGKFGVLGAYDGHRADVGRVVVDATWHHWFNINMTPYENATTPGHATYDPAVEPKWEEIKSYFRNVAAWSSPPGIQSCLRNGGWLFTLGHHEIALTFQDIRRLPNPLTYYWQLGVFARDALGRLAGRCQTTEWIWKWPLHPYLELFIDPWDPRIPEPPFPGPLPFIDLDDFSAVALGGAVHALAATVGDGGDEVIQRLLEDQGETNELAVTGARDAMAIAAEQYRASCRVFEEESAD